MRVLFLLFVLGTALAAPRVAQRIVGGEVTTVQQYPFIANVQYAWHGALWFQECGGTLLTNLAVLSAASCFYEHDSEVIWRVVVGAQQLSGGARHRVSQLVQHPQYSALTRDNDVAIVRLVSFVVFSPTVQAARVAGPNYLLQDGTTVTAVGFGRLWFGGSYPEQLQRVDVNVINQAECAERYALLRSQPGFENYPDVTSNMMCTGIPDLGGKNACQGDYGGPLLHEGDIVVGVLSWAYRCGDAEYPGVSTRVSHYTNWIVDNA